MVSTLKYANPAQASLAWDTASDRANLHTEGELLTTSVAPRSFALTSRDLDIIYSTGIYKYLSIFQLQRLHFPSAKYYRTATNRIGALISAGLLSRTFYHPRLTATTGRPASILYVTSANLQTLATLLSRKSKASLFARFEDITPTDRSEFAYSSMMHELGISELYIALERSDRPDSLVFWERTSPKMEGITEKFRANIETEDGTKTQTLTFNPDGFLCYRTPDDSLTFYFHEHDNNTETNLFYLYRKYAGYLAFHKERHFPDLLRHFLNKHGLSIPDHLINRADFRVLTTAPDPDRRDKLIREINKLEKCDRFYFASLSDLTPETVHTSIWRKASDYDPIAKAEKQLPRETKPTARARFIAERMPSLPCYALSD
jgi:protein involved in plasmid replication-relaxation